MDTTRLKESFNDRNGKISSKRVWAAIVVCNGLLLTWYEIVIKSLILFNVIDKTLIFSVDVSLILGILGVGAGLFASTFAEKQNTFHLDEGLDNLDNYDRTDNR